VKRQPNQPLLAGDAVIHFQVQVKEGAGWNPIGVEQPDVAVFGNGEQLVRPRRPLEAV
jgi:hypothetical protein